jgi:hypothetical protein
LKAFWLPTIADDGYQIHPDPEIRWQDINGLSVTAL